LAPALVFILVEVKAKLFYLFLLGLEVLCYYIRRIALFSELLGVSPTKIYNFMNA
jgi:hypothetical protein